MGILIVYKFISVRCVIYARVSKIFDDPFIEALKVSLDTRGWGGLYIKRWYTLSRCAEFSELK